MLEAKAEKGGIKEAEALMNGYMYQTPADMEGEQATALARKWYEKWIVWLHFYALTVSLHLRVRLLPPASRPALRVEYWDRLAS